VASLAEDLEVDHVRAREERTGLDADGAGRQRGVVMDGDGEVGAGESRIEAVGEHRHRAGADLFGRLRNHHQRAVPALGVRRQLRRGADPRRHMKVVAARVHDGDRLAGGVFRRDLAREREAGFFLYGKSVGVGAHHQRGAGAILQDADDARLADAGRHREAEGTEALGELGGRGGFLERKLGVSVQVFIQGPKLRPGRVGARWVDDRGKKRRDDGELCEHGASCETRSIPRNLLYFAPHAQSSRHLTEVRRSLGAPGRCRGDRLRGARALARGGDSARA
jgi:hypothetical protein